MLKLIAIASVSSAVGCASMPPQIVYPGTAAYDARVKTLKVSVDEARAIASATFTPTAFWHGPLCLIDEWYVFGEPYKYARVDLRGTYVNGNTGESEERKSDAYLLGGESISGVIRGFPDNMPDSVTKARHPPR